MKSENRAPIEKTLHGRVPVIVNRRAGSGEDWRNLEALFEHCGVEARIRALDPPEMLQALIAVQREGPEAVFVGGGDGTARLAASLFYKSDIALGVLPLGTLNHFSRDLGVPPLMSEAVPALVSGRIEHIDIGSVNGMIFVNNASIGIYPRVVRERTRIQERLGISKYFAMTIALLSVFRRTPLYHLILHNGGEQREIMTSFLFVGNNLYKPEIFSPAYRESLTDGVFSLFYAHRATRLELAIMGCMTLLGLSREGPKLEMKTVGNFEMEVETGRRGIETALDGEVISLRAPLVFRLLPKTLKVILPGKAR